VPTAAAVRKYRKRKRIQPQFEVYEDDAGDLILEVDSNVVPQMMYICVNRDMTVPAGKTKDLKSDMLVRIPYNSWALVSGLVDFENMRPYNVSCDMINNPGPSRMRIMIIAGNDYDVKLKYRQRIAKLQIMRCKEVNRYRVQRIPFKSPERHKACAAVNTSGSDSEPCARMPLIENPNVHRPKINPCYVFSACVARPVTKKEAYSNPKAKASLDKEWTKLRNITTWDESRVEEWSVVAARAKRNGIKVHIGRIFDICVEKNSELDESDPNRKFKGRVVFEGCYVKDEDNNWAIFSEIASCPASMEASRLADASGMLPGHSIEIATPKLNLAAIWRTYDYQKSDGLRHGNITMTQLRH
jgi:hypothetical protein